MLLVRTGGIFGVLVALVVAGIFMFVVRPAINDTTERAFDTADRALDRAQRQADDIQGTIARATDTDDYLSPAAFGAVVADLKAELGPDAELLDFTATSAGGNVKFRTADRAAGFTWGQGRKGLEPVEVTLIGSGKLEDNVFPIAKLTPDATTRLTAAIRHAAGAGFVADSMTLSIAPASGAVRWTVTGEGDGRQLVYTARADGSGLKPVN